MAMGSDVRDILEIEQEKEMITKEALFNDSKKVNMVNYVCFCSKYLLVRLTYNSDSSSSSGVLS